jgi:WXG100 family type VII secretion target
MAGNIRVSTDQVAQIASSIENLNQRLSEELKNSQNTVQNLSNYWEGEASQATIASYDEFASKYFQKYYDIIDNYVKFLRINVDQAYVETETHNINLADQFK